MATVFPGALDSWTAKTDGAGGDEIIAAHVNNLQDAVAAMQTKLGINSSSVVGSVDYLLKNALSVDPGHHHTAASIDSVAPADIAWSGLTPGHALFASGASAAAFRKIQEADIEPGSIYAKLTVTQTASALWTFNGGLSSTFLTMKSQGGSGVLSHVFPTTDNIVLLGWPITNEAGALLNDGNGALTWGEAGGGIITTASGAIRRPNHFERELSTSTATNILTTPDIVPAGSIIERVVAWNRNAPGTTYGVSIPGVSNLWGKDIAGTAEAHNLGQKFTAGVPVAADTPIVVYTENGANWPNNTGDIVVVAFFIEFEPPTA